MFDNLFWLQTILGVGHVYPKQWIWFGMMLYDSMDRHKLAYICTKSFSPHMSRGRDVARWDIAYVSPHSLVVYA